MNFNARSTNGLSKNDIVAVINGIQLKTRFKLSENHVRIVILYLERIDPRYMEQYGKQWVLKNLTDDLVNQFTSPSPKRLIDMHEVQKEKIGVTSEDTSVYIGSHIRDDGDPIVRSEEKVPHVPVMHIVNVDNLFGLNKSYNIRKMFNPGANYSHAYLNIDTRYRVLDPGIDNFIKEFKFNIHHNDNMVQGSINILGYVRDIVTLEIAPFQIPKTSNTAVRDEIIQYNRVTLRFHEFDAQGVIGHENRYFHFEFVVRDERDRFYELIPLPNTNAKFYFRKPITILSNLTLSFGTPLQPLLFDKDRIVFTITNPAGILRFTTATGENHNLTTGDLIYAEKFNTDDPDTDVNLIQSINRDRGHKITNVFNTIFDIDLVALGLSDAVGNIIPSTGIELFLGSKRIFFKIRLTYIAPLDENED